MLTSVLRLGRFDQRFEFILFKTLIGECSDPQAMSEWSAQPDARLRRRI
jgi:hypothetical protein